mmetsp:Transcript_57591/g.95644  ORF Transcript_57591/g.95644 Transcript_57591/m.95644 type:complete len:182 (-) Transcript_57591:117-662(-)|eukprot:CAMPEP_0202687236 /NCGR_PEP_ID=MMETSP1385-20130828/2934_1 /ASSEMBLY_ACC=CAM_ASM_000861 /TAXON_ID=933848 /ORGANISM="Elphidium margaritaceum" /LENGTH=181 /DNA_ID=CAMNT_0049341991 /DNA_START=50 /DNA_END=595 /DNA_ORIENTATION=+
MPAYHSKQKDVDKFKKACKAAVMPLRAGSVKGPAGEFVVNDKESMDIVDEAIHFFRANILFTQFDVEPGGADLTLAYLTAWIADCLRKLQKDKTKDAAVKSTHQIGINKKFNVPGDAKFEFAAFFTKPTSNSEKQLFVDYFQQIRHETLKRLIEKVYDEKGQQNKHWFQFSKKRFMNAWNM